MNKNEVNTIRIEEQNRQLNFNNKNHNFLIQLMLSNRMIIFIEACLISQKIKTINFYHLVIDINTIKLLMNKASFKYMTKIQKVQNNKKIINQFNFRI